jgi:hypothetical protein
MGELITIFDQVFFDDVCLYLFNFHFKFVLDFIPQLLLENGLVFVFLSKSCQHVVKVSVIWRVFDLKLLQDV